MEQYLNYIKNVSEEVNQEVELKIDYDTLKAKLMVKYRKNAKKVDEILTNYQTIKNKFQIYND